MESNLFYDIQGVRIAIVHEWWTAYGGSENVVLEIARMLPGADVWVMYKDSNAVRTPGLNNRFRETWFKRIPGHNSRLLTVLFEPFVYATLPFKEYDLVIVSSHSLAHSITLRRRKHCKYVGYVHTPARAIWMPEVDPRLKIIGSSLVRKLAKKIDRFFAGRLDEVVANSVEVSQRIQEYWGRSSEVVYPPVNIEECSDFFRSNNLLLSKKDYLLSAGRFVEYKRHDISIKVASLLGKPLVLMGAGPKKKELLDLAQKLQVDLTLVESPDRETWLTYLMQAQFLIFPGIEDFGITPIESIALGTPVLAFAKGGATEYVIEGVNGYLVNSQDPEAFALKLEQCTINNEYIRESVSDFNTQHFQIKLARVLKKQIDKSFKWT